MSFNTGGHVVYLTQPDKASQPHAISESNGSLLVFTAVPSSGADLDAPQDAQGTLVPEPLIGGRIVG